jgi:superfamily I DNA and/or RNA helicase
MLPTTQPAYKHTGIHEDGKTVEINVGKDLDAVNNTFVVPTFGEQRRLDESSAFYNATEAEVVVCLVDSLLAEHRSLQAAKVIAEPVTAGDVGVICLSQAQVVHVRNLLRRCKLAAVNVGTVDNFQGQELRVIFISTVLTCLVRCVAL